MPRPTTAIGLSFRPKGIAIAATQEKPELWKLSYLNSEGIVSVSKLISWVAEVVEAEDDSETIFNVYCADAKLGEVVAETTRQRFRKRVSIKYEDSKQKSPEMLLPHLMNSIADKLINFGGISLDRVKEELTGMEFRDDGTIKTCKPGAEALLLSVGEISSLLLESKYRTDRTITYDAVQVGDFRDIYKILEGF